MKSRFSRYFRSLTVGLGLVILAVAGLRCAVFSRKDPALLHIPVNYAETAYSSVYTSRRKRLPAKVKKGFGVVKVSDLRAGENIVQLIRQGFVLNATTVITAEKSFYFGNGGGGKNPLFNPNELKYCNAFENRSERPLPKPLSKRRLKGFGSSLNVSRRLPPISSASAFKAGRYSQSPFHLIETDSPAFIDAGDSFETRNDRLDNSVVPSAVKATKKTTGHEIENIYRVQQIKGKTIVLDETDKSEMLQDMDNVVNKLLDEQKEAEAILNKVKEQRGSIKDIKHKEEQVKRLEHKISLEIKQRKYHAETTCNEDYISLVTDRTPNNSSHGNIALACKMYDEFKLSEDQKRSVNNQLRVYFKNVIYGKQTRTNPVGKLKECSDIADSALRYCFDVNPTRTKKAEVIDVSSKKARPLGDPSEREIGWLEKQADCEDERYKRNPIKDKTYLVDFCLINKIASRLMR